MARMKLDREATGCASAIEATSMTLDRVVLWTGFTFVGYFTPIRELFANVIGLSVGRGRRSGCSSTVSRPTAMPVGCASRSASTCAPTRASRGDVRPDTLVITYDRERANRGAAARRARTQRRPVWRLRGLRICVQVCPRASTSATAAVRVHRLRGLHRRLQPVMDKMATREAHPVFDRECGEAARGPRRIIRVRSAACAHLCGHPRADLIFADHALAARTGEVDVIRDRVAMAADSGDGTFKRLSLQIMNTDETRRSFTISASGLEGWSSPRG